MNIFHARTSASRKGNKRSGAAIAEFAVVCPILAIVLLGMIELCRGTMVKVTLSDAARKGCRTGIQRDRGNNDNVSGGITGGIISDCTNIMRDNGFDSTKFNPGGGLGSITIVVTPPPGYTLPNPGDALDAPSGSIVEVRVSIPVSSTTWVPSMFLTQGSLESETVIMMKQ
jgi:hypothetical protein